MICKKCSEEPIAKGIKSIKCLKCGKETLNMVDYGQVCGECCEKENICEKCGNEINFEDFNDLQLRETKQDCRCKVCDKRIYRNTEKVVYFKPWTGHSDPVHICMDCIDKISVMIKRSK